VIIELHSHTSEHSSCSHVSAADLIEHCISRDLHGLVFTDHHYQWTSLELSELVKRCSVPDYFIVLSAQEVRTDFGDVLVYGADASIQEGTSAAEIARRFPNAALVLAHPYRNGRNPGDQVLMHPVFHAIEIFNANQSILENVRGLQDWHRHRFTAVGGTDIHSSSGCGTYPTVFDHPIESIDALAREIRAGRCRPLLSEIPHSGTSHRQVTELRIGRPCPSSRGDRLILKAHQNRGDWESGERTHKIMEAIADHGFRRGTFRVPMPLGGDEKSLVLIEEGVQGALLFNHLIKARQEDRSHILALTARWLAELHRLNLKMTPAGEFLEREPGRIERYLSILYTTANPHTGRIRQIADRVLAYEFQWYQGRPDLLSQGHGDFHPKNILIGQENAADPFNPFVAAVDFHSSYQLPHAYDVGTFVAQYENQLRLYPHVLHHAPPGTFVDAYLAASGQVAPDFRIQVELFKARTALSIMHYLVKVGLGESDNLWQVILSAERSLIRVEAENALSASLPDSSNDTSQ
jgi:3',5'-nucleoside bisphosphate phosphatase